MLLSESQPRLPPPPPPQALKFLIVSNDNVILNRIKNQLPQSHYQISIIPCRTMALSFLKCANFDLVLSDCSSTDMNIVYEFIFQVRYWRRDIPHVVIFEAERSGHEISTAITLGACYILRKPLREPSDEVTNLYQHVLRTRAQNEGSSSLVSSQQESQERGNEFMNHGEEPSSKKRARFVWTDERHARFVEVVTQLGPDALPKSIFRAMKDKEPGLTREIVGSHLQKHRKKEEEREGRQLREQHIFVPPVVPSSSYHDMSHLHLPEASTTDAPPPPGSVIVMQPQPIAAHQGDSLGLDGLDDLDELLHNCDQNCDHNCDQNCDQLFKDCVSDTVFPY